jgi:hypothetical protein
MGHGSRVRPTGAFAKSNRYWAPVARDSETTDPVDHERPLVLVAAGLGVPTEQEAQANTAVVRNGKVVRAR